MYKSVTSWDRILFDSVTNVLSLSLHSSNIQSHNSSIMSSKVNDSNSDHSLTSLNLTIAMSFFGMLSAIATYVFFTKWKCLNNQTLWTHQLLPYVKPIWDKLSPILKEYLYAVCCSCCYQIKKQEESALINAEERNGVSNGYGSTRIQVEEESGSMNDRHTIDRDTEENESQNTRNVDDHNSDGEEGGNDLEDIDVNYHGITNLDTANGNTDCEQGAAKLSDDDSQNEEPIQPESKPLLNTKQVIFIFSLTQILARPFIIAVNIAYLVIYGKNYVDSLVVDTSSGLWGAVYGLLYQETVLLVVVPISNAIYWTCCWRQCKTKNSLRRFLEFLRFSDLTFVIFFAPFSNTHFYVLGGWWYLALIVRLFFYGVTFAAGVVAGIRFVFAIFCKIIFTCGCEEDVLEIRNLSHLLLEVGLKIIPIFLRINASSSALATFLKLVPNSSGGIHFKLGYYWISLIRSITALFSLCFTGAMLRWAVLTQEHKLNDKKRLTTVLRFLDKYQPHVHISFFFDMFLYFSLIVLNLILLELLSDPDTTP